VKIISHVLDKGEDDLLESSGIGPLLMKKRHTLIYVHTVHAQYMHT